MRTLLLATCLLALAAPALSGCIGTALATAMEARDRADDAARLWADDATLASALGVEGNAPLARWGVAFLVGDEPPGGADDRLVGDGRAEAWLYRYVSPSRDDAYVVVVDRDGNVRRAEEETRRADDAALPAWRVDSDEALARAKDHNQGLAVGSQRDEYGVLAILRTEDARPVWLVLGGGRDATGGGLGYVKLDADTGEVLESRGGSATR